jgi:predicted Zn-dependent protease
MRTGAAVLGIVGLFVGVPARGYAQSAVCAIPEALFQSTADADDLFSPRQEVYLGEAIASHVESSFRPIEDDALVAPLRKLGEHLARHLPESPIPFQFFLVDMPVVQAFTLPGGRVYVSRKLVGFSRSIDELAGVLGHEMGHVVGRHATKAYSTLFREVLGVTELSDRADVFRRYNELLEAGHGFRGWDDKDEHGEQVAADRIGAYAVLRSGFSPEAFVSFWDRLADTEGKEGN